MGLGAAHGAADMARAVVESVAWDVLRVMEVVTVGRLGGSTAEGVTLGGAGSGLPVWVEVLTSVLGLPALRHRSGEAASAGAALLAGKALGMGLTLDQIDPVAAVIRADPRRRRALPRAAAPGRPRGRGRARRHRVAPGNRSARALTRARRAGLRPPRDGGRGPRRRRGHRPGGRAGPDGRGRVDHRGPAAAPGPGAPLDELAAGADAGRRRLPRPDAPDAEPHRAAAAAGRAGALRGARRPHHAAVRHRDPPAGHARPRWRSSSGPRSSGATPSSTTTRRARRTSPWARSTGRRCCCSASTSRPTCASSPASSSRTSSPASAAGRRRSARVSPPPRPSWRRTTRAALPMPGRRS